MKQTLKYVLFILLFFIVHCNFFSQNPVIDSLKTAFKNAKHDTTRCAILDAMVESENDDNIWPKYNEQLLKLAERNITTASDPIIKNIYLKHFAGSLNNIGFLAYVQADMKKALEYYNKCLKIQEDINDKKGIAVSLYNIGDVYNKQGNATKALDYFNWSLKVATQIKDKPGMASSLNNIGLVYHNLGNIPKALDYYHKSLKIKEEINDVFATAATLSNIAFLYNSLGEVQKSLVYNYKILKIYEDFKKKRGIAETLNRIGEVYFLNGNIDAAYNNFQKCFDISESLKDKSLKAVVLNNLGNIYNKKGNKVKALEYFQLSLKIREELKDKKSIAFCLNSLAETMLEAGQTDNAYNYVRRSLQMSKELGYPKLIEHSAAILKIIYVKQNKFKEAYEMYGLFIRMRDSLNNQETQKASIKKQAQYNFEKNELKRKVDQDKKDIIAKEELKQKVKQGNYFRIGFVLVFVFLAFIFRRYWQKQKTNKIITEQKKLADEKQKEILDSIHYAKRIQMALLPTEKYIEKSINRLREIK